MTTTPTVTAAPIGDTAWYLVKILHVEGCCDHCGRSLKHLYEVVNPEGREMTVGRGCVKRITGWTLSYAQAQQALRSAARGVEMDRRRAIVSAEYPGLADANAQVQEACRAARAAGFDAMSGYSRVPTVTRSSAAVFSTATHEDHLWRGDEGWREYLASV